jgi:hypothetical protein
LILSITSSKNIGQKLIITRKIILKLTQKNAVPSKAQHSLSVTNIEIPIITISTAAKDYTI